VNYAEHIANLKATREAKSKRMKELHALAADEGRTLNTAEDEEFETIESELKSIDKDIARTERLKSIEDAEKSSATPVDDSGKRTTKATETGIKTVQAKDTTKLEKGVPFARMARVKALAHTGLCNGIRDEAEVAKRVYPQDDQLVEAIQKSGVSAANTLTGNGAWAGNLINEGGAAFADFVEWLRPRTVLGQISDRLRRLPFDTPVLVQGSGGSGKWVKEGTYKPLTKWSYSRTKLAPLKVAAIAAATKETLMRASIAADTLLRDELGRAIGVTVDTTLVSDDPAATDESPAGLFDGVEAMTLEGDGTVKGIRCDIAAMMKELIGDNLTLSGAFWIMPETLAVDLSLVANEVGATAFPGIGPTGGTLAGLPVFTSQHVPVGSDGPVVGLIKGDEIFLGDEGGIQVSMSDQATLVMDDAPTGNSTTPTGMNASGHAVVSLWQTNSVAFLVERIVNWQKRRAEAVVWAHVNWSACAGS
jgi:HK97 family phage major capsid protein